MEFEVSYTGNITNKVTLVFYIVNWLSVYYIIIALAAGQRNEQNIYLIINYINNIYLINKSLYWQSVS